MQELIVNGKFLTQKITGVQRYAREVLRQLNNKSDVSVTVIVPQGTDDFTKEYPNIKFEVVGKHHGYYWEQFEFAKYCKKHKNIPVLNMCNISPFKIRNSYVVLHDTTFKDKNNYTSKLWSLRYKILVRSYINKVTKIFTDSLFTKNLIKKYYKKIQNDPVITYIGYEQIENIEIEELKDIPDNFIFSVGSVNPNKNFKYVLYLAKNNPDKNFIVSGKLNSDFDEIIKKENINNVKFTGYLSDGQLKYLYSKCDSFILPSFYEGFGIPPIEALAAGCKKIILSDIEVFHELYGDLVNYCNHLDYENTIDLNNLKEISEENVKELLNKYCWKNVTNIILSEIFEGYKNE